MIDPAAAVSGCARAAASMALPPMPARASSLRVTRAAPPRYRVPVSLAIAHPA